MFNLQGGGDYACVKLLMILKMLKCFGHNVHQQSLSPRQQERHVSVPMEMYCEGFTGKILLRAQQRRLQALCCSYLKQRLLAHSGALILQPTRRSEL